MKKKMPSEGLRLGRDSGSILCDTLKKWRFRTGWGGLLNVRKTGNYCGFNAGTLIGNKGSQDNLPIIGDNVGFGPGAKAFGKISIGDNVFVAANAVVVKDVPSNVIVAGIPAKIIKERENNANKK